MILIDCGFKILNQFLRRNKLYVLQMVLSRKKLFIMNDSHESKPHDKVGRTLDTMKTLFNYIQKNGHYLPNKCYIILYLIIKSGRIHSPLFIILLLYAITSNNFNWFIYYLLISKFFTKITFCSKSPTYKDAIKS